MNRPTRTLRKPISNTKEKLTFYVTMIVSTTLCLCMLAMVGAFLLGLWAKEVENGLIFALIGPAFQTIVGGMIGFLSGVKLMQGDDKSKCKDFKKCWARRITP
jgi:ABC-type transport system involved in multi-copper enzyme maturation permease subunit